MQKSNIVNLVPYTSARDLYKKGVFLDANENYQQWIKVDWSKAINLNRYPDPTADELRKAIVNFYLNDFNKENIFVGRGSDEIIDLLIKGYVESDEFVMVMEPSYSVYQVQANINNVGCKKIALQSDFSLDLRAVKSNLNKVKIIFLCSPNNPTGNLIGKKEVAELLKSFSGLLVIDEAYIEYAGLENSLSDFVRMNKRVVVLRTFSKAWGLAGIRLGYAIAQPPMIKTLIKIKDSYNISSLSQLVGIQAMKQVAQLKKRVRETMKLKAHLEKQINASGYETIPNKANFILLRVRNAKKAYEYLSRKGIIVRDRSNLPLLDNVLRVTVGSKDENSKLLSLINDKNFRRQDEGAFDSIIFDIDGVLIDVTKSYREAIKKTANYILEKYGYKSEVSDKDIEAIKRIPGFNNDWDVTYALVKVFKNKIRNITPASVSALTKMDRSTKLYSEAKDIFQAYYLGPMYQDVYKKSPPLKLKSGLISREKLCIDKNTLVTIAKQYKISVATSRPRYEALYALRRLGIVPNLIQEKYIVAQEDAPREKPFPDPLLEAQKRLKSSRPVYVGDSVNDVIAANAARIPSIYIGKEKFGTLRFDATLEVLAYLNEKK